MTDPSLCLKFIVLSMSYSKIHSSAFENICSEGTNVAKMQKMFSLKEKELKSTVGIVWPIYIDNLIEYNQL